MKKHLLMGAAMVLAPAISMMSGAVRAEEPADAAAAAQETAPPGSWIDDTVIVTGQRPSFTAPKASTATRTSTPVEEVPQSIQVLTRSLLEDQSRQVLTDALANVSGVVPTSTMQTVLQATLVRGFAVNYFHDGIASYQLPPSAIDSATLVNVERIEVAKGPAATLYGGGTGAPLAGLVNVISRDPDDSFGGTLSVRAGSFNTLGFSGGVSVPLGEDAGLRVDAMTETADSHIDFIDSERYAIFPSIVADLSPDTRFALRGRYSHLEQREYAGLPAELTQPALLVDPYQYAGANDVPRTSVENRGISAFLSHNFSEALEVRLEASIQENEVEEWATFPYGQIFGTIYNFGSGYLPSETRKTYLSASLVYRVDTGSISHQLLAGFDYDHTKYYGALNFNPFWAVLDYAAANPVAPFGGVPPLFYDQRDRMESLAAFVQDQISIGDDVDITLGLRWTNLDIHSVTAGIPTDDSEGRLTPRVGLTWKVADGLSLFAGYAEGFQGVTGGGFFFLTPEPEESQSYEAGLKFAAPVDGLTGTIAIFEVTRQNVITPDPVIPFAYVQTGEQRARGAEFDFVYEPDPSLSLLLAYAYTDAEVTEDNSLPVGDRLRNVPRHSGRLAAHYRFLDGALDGFEIGGGLTFTSERELTIPNSLRVDSLVLADLQASYDFGPAALSLSVVNLFDEDAFAPYQYLGGAYVVPVQPLSAFVTLDVSF